MAKHSLKSNVRLLFSNPLTLQVIGTRWWVGVDSAWEQEKLEARKMPARSVAANPTCPVHLRRMGHPISPKKQGRKGSILRNGRHISRTQQWRRAASQSRAAPWFPIQMIYPLVAWVGRMDQDPTTPIRKLSTLNDRVCQQRNDERASASFSKMVVTPFCG